MCLLEHTRPTPYIGHSAFFLKRMPASCLRGSKSRLGSGLLCIFPGTRAVERLADLLVRIENKAMMLGDAVDA